LVLIAFEPPVRVSEKKQNHSFLGSKDIEKFSHFCRLKMKVTGRLLTSFRFYLMPEPCEDEELEAEADSPDMEPGTELDQGKQSK